jgi:hypothetical protein
MVMNLIPGGSTIDSLTTPYWTASEPTTQRDRARWKPVTPAVTRRYAEVGDYLMAAYNDRLQGRFFCRARHYDQAVAAAGKIQAGYKDLATLEAERKEAYQLAEARGDKTCDEDKPIT